MGRRKKFIKIKSYYRIKPTYRLCPSCGGKGIIIPHFPAPYAKKCPKCKGYGDIKIKKR